MKKTLLILLLSCLSIRGWTQGGGLDNSYNPSAALDNSIHSISVQSDQKIIVAGSFQHYASSTVNRIIRLNSTSAILDPAFQTGTGADNSILYTLVLPDGKILITGMFQSFNGVTRHRIAQLNSDGSLDTSFDPGNLSGIMIYAAACQSDGKILIGGLFDNINGTPRNNIARLNADGSLDSSFDPGTGTNDYVSSITLQNDGKILIGGNFTAYNDISKNYLVRLNEDGTPDSSFDPGTGTDTPISVIRITSDQKILIAGKFTSYNNTPVATIARLESNGTLDASFNPGTGANNYIITLLIQPDDKILIGGSFTEFNGLVRNRIERLLPDGSQDLFFNAGTGTNAIISTSCQQADGKILIGGTFTSYNGSNRKHLARIYDGCGITASLQHKYICEGDSFVFNNNTYSEVGFYIDTLQTSLGCDSLVITNLVVNEKSYHTQYVVTCSSIPYVVGTSSYNVTGIYQDTLINAQGCDSIITTNLTVIPSETNNIQTICQGKSIMVGTSEYRESGTYVDIFTLDEQWLYQTCDLTITTYLTVLPAPVHNNPQMICAGEAYQINGSSYSAEGTYRDTIQDPQGCDSIVVTEITFYETDVSVTQSGTELSANISNASYQWLDVANGYSPLPGENNQAFSPLVSGSYAVEVTDQGCTDTSSVYTLVLTGVQRSALQQSIRFSPNPVQDRLELSVEGAYSINAVKVLNSTGQLLMEGNSLTLEMSSLPKGMYFLMVETDKGLWKEAFIKL